MAIKKALGRIEIIELVAGIFLTAISIIAIVRIGSLETKNSLHLHLYKDAGCHAEYKIKLQANPTTDEIEGTIKQPPQDRCEKVLLLSSLPVKSASQSFNGSIPVAIEVARSKPPKVFAVWYSFNDIAPGKFLITDIDLSPHVRNRLLLNIGSFDMRDLTGWTQDVKKFVASAPQPKSTRLQIGVFGDYEVSANPHPNSCYEIEHAGDARAGEECIFDRLGSGDLLKLQVDPGDLNATQNFWIILVGLFASSGFGLFFDAIRRTITKSIKQT